MDIVRHVFLKAKWGSGLELGNRCCFGALPELLQVRSSLLTIAQLWPDDWYGRILFLFFVTYVLHWIVAYYIDWRLEIVHEKWYRRISGTVPVGQALIVACLYFVFTQPPFFEDLHRGLEIAFKVIAVVLILIGFILSGIWMHIVEANDSKAHFEQARSTTPGGANLVYSAPGFVFIQLVWFALLLFFGRKNKLAIESGQAASITSSTPGSLDNLDIAGSLKFVPYSRFALLILLPTTALGAAILAFVVSLVLSTNGSSTTPTFVWFLLAVGSTGLICLLAAFFGGLSITDNGIDLRAKHVGTAIAIIGLVFLFKIGPYDLWMNGLDGESARRTGRSILATVIIVVVFIFLVVVSLKGTVRFTKRGIVPPIEWRGPPFKWSEIRSFNVSEHKPDRLVVELNGKKKWRFGKYGYPIYRFRLPFEIQAGRLAEMLNRELRRRRVDGGEGPDAEQGESTC